MKTAHLKNIAIALLSSSLLACGGDGDSSSNTGSPSNTDDCSITSVSISSGNSASLSKSSSQLTTQFQLNLRVPTSLEIVSNFENSAGDDWIEAVNFMQSYPAGSHNVTLQYDLNSPSKTAADRYTKFNITSELPGNKACVYNSIVDLRLNP